MATKAAAKKIEQQAHTPGPWRVVEPHSSENPRLLIVADYSPEEAKEFPASVRGGLNGKWIADVRRYSGTTQPGDAKLIAASPKMAEALTTTLGNVRSLKHTRPGVRVYDEWERMLVETLTAAGVPVEAAQ